VVEVAVEAELLREVVMVKLHQEHLVVPEVAEVP
jgi:hypothetical protein